jgi:16S rRNA G966 N2-methylase RsmD
MALLRLHRNVQFIYEKALAELELKSFGISDFSNTFYAPWDYEVPDSIDSESISAQSAYFGDIDGVDTVYKKLITPNYQGGKLNVSRSVNQYLTHWIYPYKGKFHPQMIRAIFNVIGLQKGDIVLDPFSGSGTTVLEASIAGYDSIGIDISKLCVLIGKVKTKAWKHAVEIERIAQNGYRDADHHDSAEIEDFFQLAKMVALSDVARRSREYEQSLSRNVTKMIQSVLHMKAALEIVGHEFGSTSVFQGDIRDLHQVQDASIDAIVTSPPYSIALDYVKNDQHALSEMGEDVAKIRDDFIGVRGKPKDKMMLYEQDMKKALITMHRILKNGKYVVIVIGNATLGSEVRTTEEIIGWAESAGLHLEFSMPKIVYGLYNLITDENILFFKK